jgi:uncharacterized protein involved in outer membrane biogenesis
VKNWRPHWRGWSRDRRVQRGAFFAAIPIAVVLLFLAFFEWNMLRGLLAGYLSSRTGREVHIDGDLDVDLGWSPIVTVNGIRVSNPEWVGDPDMAVVDRTRVQFRLLPLFIGQLTLPFVHIERPQIGLVREESGRANWDSDSDEGLKLPLIHSLRIDNGHLNISDAVRDMTFVGTVNSREGGAQEGAHAFFLEGEGALNRRPFLMEVKGEPLLNVSRTKPYGFIANVTEGATHVVIDGSILEPFDFGHIEARLTINGNDVADLYHLTGLALPNTPPYRISGGIRRDDDHYVYREFSGKVGDSDVQGTLDIDVSGERPYVEGTMRSRRLDFDDLGTVIGAPPDPTETAAPVQRAEAREMIAEQRLLPDAPLQVDRIRKMDAKVRYTADTVNAPDLPLTRVVIGVDLKNGVLVVDPMSFNMTRGAIGGRARVDARRDIPSADLDVVMNNARLEEFFDGTAATAAVTGPIEARMKISGRGLSVHQVASNANGQFAVAIPNGEIRKTIAELLGVNVASALGLLFSGDESRTELRCSVADFQVRGGNMVAQTFILDTGPTIAKGSGTINLRNETLNLRLEGEPKDPELIRLIAPITITGKLAAPKIGVEPGAAIAQVGIAGLLASLVSPLATILPFLSPGLADDANCQALIAQARREGVPVATSQTPAGGTETGSASPTQGNAERGQGGPLLPPNFGTPLPRGTRVMEPSGMRPRAPEMVPPASAPPETAPRASAPPATMAPVGR